MTPNRERTSPPGATVEFAAAAAVDAIAARSRRVTTGVGLGVGVGLGLAAVAILFLTEDLRLNLLGIAVLALLYVPTLTIRPTTTLWVDRPSDAVRTSLCSPDSPLFAFDVARADEVTVVPVGAERDAADGVALDLVLSRPIDLGGTTEWRLEAVRDDGVVRLVRRVGADRTEAGTAYRSTVTFVTADGGTRFTVTRRDGRRVSLRTLLDVAIRTRYRTAALDRLGYRVETARLGVGLRR